MVGTAEQIQKRECGSASGSQLLCARSDAWCASCCGGVCVKTILLAALLLISASSLFAQERESCPTGTEDMLNYFTMAYPNRLTHHMGPGNANPVYTNITPDLGSNFATTGRFIWIKSSQGFPWDIKAYDTHYIYDRSTGVSGTDATAFKRFNIDLPTSQRCVTINQAGGQIKTPASKTNYTTYAGCEPTKTQPLAYVITNISAPATYTVGNVGPVKTRFFTYKYSCNSNYENCAFEEIFSLGRGIGLYDWKYYVNQNGKFVFKQESLINQFDSGSATPYLPCANSYQ
jgi:hypothetical protein